jgi:hypothetical protein
VNAVGEREAESEAVGRFGKSAGRYGAMSQGLGVKFVPFQNLSVQPTVAISRFDISNVPGLEDKRQLSYEAASVELRYRLIDREKAQFGLTMGFDPRWARVDSSNVVVRQTTNLRSPATMIALGGIYRKSLFASLKAIFSISIRRPPRRSALLISTPEQFEFSL